MIEKLDSFPRQIRLSRRGAVLQVRLAAGYAQAVEPFALPKLPLSLVHWLGALANLCYGQHQTCLAVSLLLDPVLKRWLPVLPTQQCGPSHARWQVRSEDYQDLPKNLLLAGSFQSTGSGSLFDALDLVPAFDGIHLVQQTGGDDRQAGAFGFIRCEGQAVLSEPGAILIDDLQDTLWRHASRLKR